jgi:hypothetical protein
MKIKQPTIIENILSDENFLLLKTHAKELSLSDGQTEEAFGRKVYGNTPTLNIIHEALIEKAKDFFETETLKPSFSILAIYQGDKASLFRHKDDNACTYHFDVCVFQETPWDIWVENDNESKPYTLKENQALAMYGNIQEHWREAFPNPDTNIVCNAFFFFCEPDHWYFTEGPEYLNVIRQQNAKQ